jgi:hypothetical protein
MFGFEQGLSEYRPDISVTTAKIDQIDFISPPSQAVKDYVITFTPDLEV